MGPIAARAHYAIADIRSRGLLPSPALARRRRRSVGPTEGRHRSTRHIDGPGVVRQVCRPVSSSCSLLDNFRLLATRFSGQHPPRPPLELLRPNAANQCRVVRGGRIQADQQLGGYIGRRSPDRRAAGASAIRTLSRGREARIADYVLPGFDARHRKPRLVVDSCDRGSRSRTRRGRPWR